MPALPAPAHVEFCEVSMPARVGDHGLPALAWQRIHNGCERCAVVAPARMMKAVQ
jgi:hypothetical protein